MWKPALIRICLSWGKRSRLRAFSASICWRACSTDAPGLQPRDVRPVVAVPLIVGLLFGGEGDRQPHLDVGIEEPEVLREHADDRIRLAVDADVAADRAVLAAEPLLPRCVGEDRLLGLADFAVLFGKDPPAQRLRLQQPEQRRRRHHRADALRFPLAAERHAARVIERLLLEDRRFAQPIVVVGHAGRSADHTRSRIGVVHVDELLGVGHRQRPQEHRIDHREDRGVGPDTEGQREDGGGGEAAILPQQPEPEPYVLQHLVLYAHLRRGVQRTGTPMLAMVSPLTIDGTALMKSTTPLSGAIASKMVFPR